MVRGARIGPAGLFRAGAGRKGTRRVAASFLAGLAAVLALAMQASAAAPRVAGPMPPPAPPADHQDHEQKAEEETVPRRILPFLPARIADLWRPEVPRRTTMAGARSEVEIFFEGHAPSPAMRIAGFWPGGQTERRGDFWFRPEPPRNMLFLGFDMTHGGRYASLGYKRALGGDLDRPGFRLLATFGGKIRDHDPLAGVTVSRLHAIRLLAGREWRLGTTNIGLYLGPSLILHAPGAAQATRRAGRAGAAGLIDIWHHWSSRANLVTALTLFVDQAERSGYMQLRQGFVFEPLPFRFGPELSLSAGKGVRRQGIGTQDGWRKTRLGGFLGDIPLGPASLSLAVGGEWRPHRRRGAYGEIGAALRY